MEWLFLVLLGLDPKRTMLALAAGTGILAGGLCGLLCLPAIWPFWICLTVALLIFAACKI